MNKGDKSVAARDAAQRQMCAGSYPLARTRCESCSSQRSSSSPPPCRLARRLPSLDYVRARDLPKLVPLWPTRVRQLEPCRSRASARQAAARAAGGTAEGHRRTLELRPCAARTIAARLPCRGDGVCARRHAAIARRHTGMTPGAWRVDKVLRARTKTARSARVHPDMRTEGGNHRLWATSRGACPGPFSWQDRSARGHSSAPP